MDKIFRSKTSGFNAVALQSIVAVTATQKEGAENVLNVRVLTGFHEVDLELTVAEYEALLQEWSKAL